MSNIPEARAKLENVESELLKLAHRFIAHKESETLMIARAHVMDALDLMHRVSHKNEKAPRQSRPMNKEVRDAIKAYHDMKPEESTSKIAQVFNVNQGRISEVLAGKYDKLGK